MASLAVAAAPPVRNLPAADNDRDEPMRDNARGVLAHPSAASEAEAGRRCLAIPPRTDDEVAQDDAWAAGPPPPCRAIAFERLPGAGGRWRVARYRRVRPAAGDGEPTTVEEVVLFEGAGRVRVRPVWRARFFVDGDLAQWRSVTPRVAAAGPGAVLVAVRYCVNGTGGCSQEFLLRGRDGDWSAVRQAWLDQLPKGYRGRIRHGFEIDPASLTGMAGFYGDGDANCCPSQELSVTLALRGDALVLLRHRLSRTPDPST